MADEPTKNDDAPKIDLSNPEVKALVDSAVETATEGLKRNRDELLAEKRETKEKLDALSKTWEGLDPEMVRAVMHRMANDEETKLIGEGKVDEVIERRTAHLRKDFEKRLGAATDKVAELEEALVGRTAKINELIVGRSVRDAAVKAGVQPSSLEDIELRASRLFKVNEEFEIEALDKDGAAIIGKDGKGTLQPAEWLEDMRETAPHWWPPSNGGGAGGARKPGQGDGPNDKELDGMSATQKMQAAIERGSQA